MDFSLSVEIKIFGIFISKYMCDETTVSTCTVVERLFVVASQLNQCANVFPSIIIHLSGFGEF